jgi:hypothetical protein
MGGLSLRSAALAAQDKEPVPGEGFSYGHGFWTRVLS